MQDTTPVSSPPIVVTITLLAVASLTVMANATIAPSLPGLRETFRDTPYVTTLVGLVMTLPSLSIVLTAALAGILADKIGRRPVMLAALVLYALAGASGLFAQSLSQLLIGRALLGCAVGCTMTTTIALIGDLYKGPARERIITWQAATMSGSGVLFLLAGGALAEAGWRLPFLLYLASLVVLIPAARLLHDVPRRPPVQPGDVEAQLPWGTLALVCGIACYSMAAYYLLPTLLPFLLVGVGVASPGLIGIAVAFSALCTALNALAFRWVRQRLSPIQIYALLFALMAAGFGVIGIAANLPTVMLGAGLVGAGLGYLFPNNNGLLLARTPDAVRGRAAGLHTTAVFLGSFLSPLIGGPIVDRLGFGGLFLGCGALSVCVALGFWMAAHRWPK